MAQGYSDDIGNFDLFLGISRTLDFLTYVHLIKNHEFKLLELGTPQNRIEKILALRVNSLYNSYINKLPNSPEETYLKELHRRYEMPDTPTSRYSYEAYNDIKIDEIRDLLSNAAYTTLKNNNFGTIGEIVKKTEMELKGYDNFGEASLQEINSLLSSMGLSFRHENGEN